MKAFVFCATSEFLGRFDVPDPDSVPAVFPEFKARQPLQAYDYVECGGRRWTLIPGESGLQLVEGRIAAGPGDRPAGGESVSAAEQHARRGETIRVFGLILGALVFVLTVLSAGSRATIEIFMAAALLGTFAGGVLHALGVLISGQALLLKALPPQNSPASSASNEENALRRGTGTGAEPPAA